MGVEVIVIKGEPTSFDQCLSYSPDYLLIGPGPGSPESATLSLNLIQHFQEKIPILGVCLGHQCIGHFFGGKVIRSPLGPTHGKTSQIFHDGGGLFDQIPSPFKATRYHSLIIGQDDFPLDLVITAKTELNEIMALSHKFLPIHGLQFHPESITSEWGDAILKNFIQMVK